MYRASIVLNTNALRSVASLTSATTGSLMNGPDLTGIFINDTLNGTRAWSNPLDFLYSREFWIWHHLFRPMLTMVFLNSVAYSTVTIFAWEWIETAGFLVIYTVCFWFNVNDFIMLFWQESKYDSMIGDIYHGMVGIIIGKLLIRKYGLQEQVGPRKHAKGILSIQIIMYFAFMFCDFLSIVQWKDSLLDAYLPIGGYVYMGIAPFVMLLNGWFDYNSYGYDKPAHERAAIRHRVYQMWMNILCMQAIGILLVIITLPFFPTYFVLFPYWLACMFLAACNVRPMIPK